MQHISLKLLKPIYNLLLTFSLVKSNRLHCVRNIAQVTSVGTFHYGHDFFFFLNPSLVFNLHPPEHSKHLLDIESNGIYNAVFGKMQNKQALYSLRPRF